MSGMITEGKLYDSTMVVLAMHEFELGSLEWKEDNVSRKIDCRRDFSTGKVNITVSGLPYDIPLDVYEDFLHNAIEWIVKGNKSYTVKATTRNWLNKFKQVTI